MHPDREVKFLCAYHLDLAFAVTYLMHDAVMKQRLICDIMPIFASVIVNLIDIEINDADLMLMPKIIDEIRN